MPFGLCNAPATFQHTMDFVLQDLKDFAGAYVDDILVHTDTLEQHVVALRSVYEALDKAKLFANPEKCVLGQSEVEVLRIHCWT